MAVDYYKVLGIDRNTPQKDIKSAYRKRSKQFHPDLHPDDPKAEAKFKKLQEAYNVLGDENKRKLYDQYGENWENMSKMGGDPFGGAGGFGGGNPFGSGNPFGGGFGGGGFNTSDLGDIFSQMFGGMGGSRRRSSGGCGGSCHSQPEPEETLSTVNIDMYTALLGGEVIVQTPSGSKIKLKVKPCTQNGTKVKLAGKGKPKSNGYYSDLIITYNVTLPESLSDKQKSLLEQMRNAG